MCLALFSASKFCEKEVPFKEGNAKFTCFSPSLRNLIGHENYDFLMTFETWLLNTNKG